jgi:toxin ParE1/3/4
MRIVWSPTARRHLAAIRAHVASHDPRAADATMRAIRNAIRRLPRFPRLGRAGRVQNTRELVVPGTPYIVVYGVSSDVVELYAVLHGARRWPDHFD